MRGLHTCALAVVAALSLSACVSQPVRTPAPVDPAQVRLADLQRASLADWSLSGRVAISGGRQGGSGRIDWTQRGERYDITLAAPVTRQGWRLSGDAGSARLEGVEGGPRESADVEDLLFAATGWSVPVRAMVDWVRAVAAPEAVYGPAQVRAGEGGLPASIAQGGWEIAYRDWYEAGIGQPALPRRIEASRGDARVRLLVDGWTVVPGGPTVSEDGHEAPDRVLARALGELRLGDPAADMRERVADGDLRPVAVCGFACLAPGYGADRDAAVGRIQDMRILDGTGDVVMGGAHLALKHQAHAYAEAYNRALRAWRQAHPDVAGDDLAD